MDIHNIHIYFFFERTRKPRCYLVCNNGSIFVDMDTNELIGIILMTHSGRRYAFFFVW